MGSSRTVIVTGAAEGLGRAIAGRLGADGYSVVVTDLKLAGAQEVAEDIVGRGGAAIGLELDVTDAGSVRAAIDRSIEVYGAVFGLVNNAGIARATRFVDMTEADWDSVQLVNSKGTFLTCRHVVPHMIAQGEGVIVNMSSIGGRDGFANWAHYNASKHAVIGLTRALAREIGPDGVRVNAVCPGAIRTQMWGAEAQGTDDPDAALAAMVANMPLRRAQTPGEIAGAVAFLLSDDAYSITGQSLGVDGGLLT
ncbi:SDR family NAD(P)-dependent oxidoreductase [Actinomycetospora termitidis]|uniref:SDR family NAD(P)-dependent oxidoreductase n=1 Tax=Actinomycetospora termitidis TaxID=3053470 RepID=A0ABT7M6D1_9PSEU|nr:SDR family NAD(P)-dependent oxidoreductase [Actinomycetospora sp. Odt1-22]MDL5156235.1 SDR family NAD(P)-dependent oxidoreductase [Actinomycetospora sp. Odt1-22]